MIIIITIIIIKIIAIITFTIIITLVVLASASALSSRCISCRLGSSLDRLRAIFVCQLVDSGCEMAPKKGGLRKRLGLNDCVERGAGAASSSIDVPRESPNTPLRGGIRRRIANSGDDGDNTKNNAEPLLANMRRRWAEGKISSPLVQEFAAGAVAQGAGGVTTHAAASAGTSGRNPQNLQRDFLNLFGKPKGSPDFFWRRIPTKDGLEFWPFLLPHLWFASLFDNAHSIWESSVEGGEGSALAIWNALASTELTQKSAEASPNKL